MAEEARAPIKEAEIPWVVAYLREDIQDLRNEVRETRRLTLESYEKLDARIEELSRDMDARIEGLRSEMDVKIEGLRQDMGELRRDMDVRFRWTLTTMVAVGALILAALKLLP